ncbi:MULTISPECIES: hypothetical protein [Pseudovibrio]|uniref:hypothetical protein n=1 Tax=Stappiaceae TaxID=2821832 RepID=UPI0023667444|nr:MULTISPECIES: hypothetical protein [Pseudovibrio]MDD7909130.1 hypothetical protein [Pseudovibrio exalbescens]MDX5595574.1 hypothetical protein [Pseudovibrio sp. SPO723]
MPNAQLKSEKLSEFLGGLSPKALRMLVRSIEASEAKGTQLTNSALVLPMAQGLIRKTSSARRMGYRSSPLQRAVFSPLQPFFINEHMPVKTQGLIERGFLDGFWRYLEDELLKSEIEQCRHAMKGWHDELDMEEDAFLQSLAAELRKQVVKAAKEQIKAADASMSEHRKLRRRLGGERYLEELEDALKIFEASERLRVLMDELPPLEKDENDLFSMKAIRYLREYLQKHPGDINYVASLLINRRGQQAAALIELAMDMCSSRDIRVVEESTFKPLVSHALCEFARQIQGVENWKAAPFCELGYPEALREALKSLEDILLLTDFQKSKHWSRVFEQTRAFITKMVREDIENTIGSMDAALDEARAKGSGERKSLRNAIRVLKVGDLMPGYAQTLGLSEASLPLSRKIEQYFEGRSNKLLSQIQSQNLQDDHKEVRAFDCLVALGENCFGNEYGSLMMKRRRAAQKAAA